MDFNREGGEHVRDQPLHSWCRGEKREKKRDAPGAEKVKKGTYRERLRHRSPDRVGDAPVANAMPNECVPDEMPRGSELFSDAPSVQHVAGGGRVPTEKLHASRAAHRTDGHLGESSSREEENNSASVEETLRLRTTEAGELNEQRRANRRK